eukprot:1138345-Pelagomonas_calceolata.AAC.3
MLLRLPEFCFAILGLVANPVPLTSSGLVGWRWSDADPMWACALASALYTLLPAAGKMAFAWELMPSVFVLVSARGMLPQGWRALAWELMPCTRARLLNVLPEGMALAWEFNPPLGTMLQLADTWAIFRDHAERLLEVRVRDPPMLDLSGSVASLAARCAAWLCAVTTVNGECCVS